MAKVAALHLYSHNPPNQASGHSEARAIFLWAPALRRKAARPGPWGSKGRVRVESLTPALNLGLSCRHSPDTLFPLPRAALGLHSHLRRPYSPSSYSTDPSFLGSYSQETSLPFKLSCVTYNLGYILAPDLCPFLSYWLSH